MLNFYDFIQFLYLPQITTLRQLQAFKYSYFYLLFLPFRSLPNFSQFSVRKLLLFPSNAKIIFRIRRRLGVLESALFTIQLLGA